jgi:hypothetical protein
VNLKPKEAPKEFLIPRPTRRVEVLEEKVNNSVTYQVLRLQF